MAGKRHKKASRKSSRRKPSRRKQLAARNECCPIVRIECAPATLHKFVTSMRATGGRGDTDLRKVREKVTYTEKRCAIRLGARTVAKGLTQGEANARMGAIRKQLTDRRCQVVVQTK